MQIDFLATEQHFLEHLLPTYKKINNSNFYLSNELLENNKNLNIDFKNIENKKSKNITVVSSFGDLKKARANGSRVILSEHGAGQSYLGIESGSYIGAADRRGVIGILVPGIKQMQKQIEAYPTIPVYPVGVPKLDYLHKDLNSINNKIKKDNVLISFHWDCNLVPETRSAFRFYKTILREMRNKFNITLHGHPRHINKQRNFANYENIDFVENFSEGIEKCWIYCCDNSSTLFEWASLERPIIFLNSHLYRRNIEHGMRFWEYSNIGANVESPSKFPFILNDVIEKDKYFDIRKKAIKEIYYKTDGRAAERAALAIETIASDFLRNNK